MVQTTDPPSDERKRAYFWKRVRGIGRVLVTKKTFLMALRLLGFAVRMAELLNRLFGDF